MFPCCLPLAASPCSAGWALSAAISLSQNNRSLRLPVTVFIFHLKNVKYDIAKDKLTIILQNLLSDLKTLLLY